MNYIKINLVILLFLFSIIICNASLTNEINDSKLKEEDNGLLNNDNNNNQENNNNKSKSKSHLFLLSIPDCSVEGVVLELGKCFNFESYGCLPSSIIIKANKNSFNNKLNSNITIENQNQLNQQNLNDYYGIIFYNTNCNSHDENEVIEFECRKSKKVKLMGNVKVQCLSSDKDLKPVQFLDNNNQYYSSSSMEIIKIYGELKPLLPDKEDEELFNQNNNSIKSIILNFNLIISIIIISIIILI